MKGKLPHRIETERTLLRPYEEADSIAAFGWFGDPEAMRFEPGGADRSVAETRERLLGYMAHQEAHGFSKWMVLSSCDRLPIGHAGLMVLEETGEIELGYRLLRSEWGKGLATEVARAWLDYGREELGLDRIIAFTQPGNQASVRVMERLGMSFCRRMVLAPRTRSVDVGNGDRTSSEGLQDFVVFEIDLRSR